MKNILLLTLLFIPQMLYAQAYELAGEGMRGRVKTVTELQYAEGCTGPCTRTVDRYDRKGNLTEEVHNDNLLHLDVRKHYKYDTGTSGYVTEMYEYDGSDSLMRTVEYRYNSKNYLVETEEKRATGEGKITYRTEYYYDSAGRKMREKNFKNNELEYHTLYAWDTAGRIAGSKSYDKKDSVIMCYDYNYLGSSGLWMHCEKKFGGTRTHIFRAIDSAGTITEKTTYVNDYSNQTTESYSNFDRNGNWQKQVVKGPESYYETRVIEYYR